MEEYSLNRNLLKDIFLYAKPLGHNEDSGTLNIGFGFLYYGLVRAVKPKHILVIGSGFGFSVVCLALGIKDNGNNGALTFIDPSYSLFKDGPFKTIGGNGQWNEPEKVTEHFRKFSVEQIVTHYKYRSEEFFKVYEALHVPDIDVAFIDGNHAFNQVKYDFNSVLRHSHKNTYIFLHDTNIYIRELLHHAGVKKLLNAVKQEEEFFEVIDFPFSSGMAVVRVLKDNTWKYIQ